MLDISSVLPLKGRAGKHMGDFHLLGTVAEKEIKQGWNSLGSGKPGFCYLGNMCSPGQSRVLVFSLLKIRP